MCREYNVKLLALGRSKVYRTRDARPGYRAAATMVALWRFRSGDPQRRHRHHRHRHHRHRRHRNEQAVSARPGRESHAHGGHRMLAWPFCVDMNRAEEVQLFRKSREVSLRSNGSGTVNGGGAGGSPVVARVGSPSADHPKQQQQQQQQQLRPQLVGCVGGGVGGPEADFGGGVKRIEAGGAPDQQQVRPPHHHRRMPRFGEAHHRRVPTPLKKRRQPREDFADPPTPSSDDAGVVEVVTAGGVGGDGKPAAPPGVPDPYYPIYLPIDQAFKAKYVFHQRKGKTFQERVYVFLEHPCGWICFIYHFAV